MSNDPFERFERSRGGLLIPILLFVLGALATVFAIDAMNRVMLVQETVRDQPQVAAGPEVDHSASVVGESQPETDDKELQP